jgi:iron complex outermembrane recepter protein
MARRSFFRLSFRLCPLSPLRCAGLFVATPFALAQPAALAPVEVRATALPQADVAGFEPQPLERLPLQARIVGGDELQSRGASRLADVVRLDASVADAYNAPGYWDFLAVRGFVLDNRFNYRRDGLPINAETSIPLDNKERVELLKGTSGLQAGQGAPGGLLNLVVARPTAQPLRSARLQWEQPGSVLGAVDLGGRAGAEGAFGLRLNAAAERLDPLVRDARGDRHLLALAGEWKGERGWLVEAEAESSRRSQPSVPAFSLLGDTLPAPGDPRLNLNNQPWSSPVVFGARTGSLRVTAPLAEGWRARLHLMRQSLDSDDRLAFPFGCSAEGRFDRYCSDGTFDLYDYRSDGERRRTDAVEASLRGTVDTGATRHDLTLGALASRTRLRFQRQAFNFVGIGNVGGNVVTPADPTLTTENTNRDEASDELYVRHSAPIGDRWRVWSGLRWTQVERRSVRTDVGEPTQASRSFAVPFIAASVQLRPSVLGYASAGQGIETEVAPNRPQFSNAGQPLPPLRSRQWELGLRGLLDAADPGRDGWGWNLALFDIVRPAFGDFGACDGSAGSCVRRLDGEVRHTGLEAGLEARQGPWSGGASALLMRARRQGSEIASINGLKPTNVPASNLRAFATIEPGGWPGLTLQAAVSASGARAALPDNSIEIPGHAQWDIAATQRLQAGGAQWTLRAGIDNLLDRRAWRESPFQFGHAYLYPLAPRTARVSLRGDF